MANSFDVILIKNLHFWKEATYFHNNLRFYHLNGFDLFCFDLISKPSCQNVSRGVCLDCI